MITCSGRLCHNCHRTIYVSPHVLGLFWGLVIISRIAGGSVVAPSTFSYITLALILTLTLKLERHTVAPRGLRIHYGNAVKGATVAPEIVTTRVKEG